MDEMVVAGNDSVDEFIRDDGYDGDKTELIYELLTQLNAKATLFTCPNRFEKMLMMRMMESFFDIQQDSTDMFTKCKIFIEHPELCKKWMNQYPVLFLTLKDVEGNSFELTYSKLEAVIADLCTKHAYLGEDERTDPDDRDIFGRLKSQTAREEEVQNSLKTIMRMMRSVYGKPVILLLDEYDVPLAKAEETKNKEFYSWMLDVIHGLMSCSMKTNEFLKLAVVTGSQDIPKVFC